MDRGDQEDDAVGGCKYCLEATNKQSDASTPLVKCGRHLAFRVIVCPTPTRRRSCKRCRWPRVRWCSCRPQSRNPPHTTCKSRVSRVGGNRMSLFYVLSMFCVTKSSRVEDRVRNYSCSPPLLTHPPPPPPPPPSPPPPSQTPQSHPSRSPAALTAPPSKHGTHWTISSCGAPRT